MKNISFIFLSENFQFLEVKISIYLNRHVFVMQTLYTGIPDKLAYAKRTDPDQTAPTV